MLHIFSFQQNFNCYLLIYIHSYRNKASFFVLFPRYSDCISIVDMMVSFFVFLLFQLIVGPYQEQTDLGDSGTAGCYPISYLTVAANLLPWYAKVTGSRYTNQLQQRFYRQRQSMLYRMSMLSAPETRFQMKLMLIFI